MLPSIKNLEYLVAVNKHLNFSRAAEECFVSQSTLSAGIAKLEDMLRLKIIERDNKSVIFTQQGLKVLDYAKEIIKLSKDLVDVAQLDFFKGEVKIGVIPTISPYLLPKFLSRVKDVYPELKVSFTEEKSETLVDKIDGMELDLAIFAFPYDVPKHIDSEVVFREKLKFVYHSDNQLDNLDEKYLILLEQGHCLREQIISSCGITEDQISNYSCSSLPTLIAMINMNMGVSLLPQMAINSNILGPYPNILVDSNQLSGAYRDIGIIYRKSNPQSPSLLELSKLIQ